MVVISKPITTGMIISVTKKLYQVESCTKVSVAQKSPFIRAELRNIRTDEVIEKNFKVGQNVNGITLEDKKLEFLFFEDKGYLFLDIDTFDKVWIKPDDIGQQAAYLKEGIEVKSSFYGEEAVNIVFPQFLELMISQIESEEEDIFASDVMQKAVLETGAVVEVPQFIKVGDIIKIDTTSGEYIQRV